MEYSDDGAKTIQCSFFKDKITNNVKIELAKRSFEENSTGPMTPPENIYDKDQNKPIELKVSFNKGRETLELKCQFNDTQDRPEKIRKIGELLKQVSIAQELPPESNCIPHFLLTENDGSVTFFGWGTTFF